MFSVHVKKYCQANSIFEKYFMLQNKFQTNIRASDII